MTPVAWALLAFVLLALAGALLRRGARAPTPRGDVGAGAPREASPPGAVARPSDVPEPAAIVCRRCGRPLGGGRDDVACLECRARHHAACWEEHQGCAACGCWPGVW